MPQLKSTRMAELKRIYEKLLRPVFGEQLRIIDDQEESHNWVTIVLDGEHEEFIFSLYGSDCVRLYWCNECFLFDKGRNRLVSSDTYGEIVWEDYFDIEQLPQMVVDLILQLKDCVYAGKKESVKGKTPSGYDDIKEYIVLAKTELPFQNDYRAGNITIRYIGGEPSGEQAGDAPRD